MKLLIVEDNADLLDNIVTYLEREGYICETAEDYDTAFHKIMSFTYDVVLIDLMLPGGDGLQVLREQKSVNPETGTIIISAKNSLDDKVTGLELGADDYLTKPFQLAELHARIKAVNRRNNLGGSEIVRVQEIAIHTKAREVKVDGKVVDLTPKEYDLMLYFASNKNHVLSKQTIAEHLWGDYADQLDNLDFVYQHIKNLRKKLVNAGANDYIESVYSIGYKLNTSKKVS
ncbi:response regulator transcription factor [Gracilimonas mengyeensis]|uniref:DNA-binding response regulator, OmpR family, contains REC and winged-helix (WHTH) domain n=1 Tax=Gracilimonas mengyeensis TaxID=1302730 RepID=A0A521CGG7_9BACT|nr:response regulator transcription factor [Gracilimonas mengyeensis]SMO58524.1 DNA-binding response regulator, OmpR family, contains REC and winged-helix (wHTH) domain [Gracilimonas mengyeensis]